MSTPRTSLVYLAVEGGMLERRCMKSHVVQLKTTKQRHIPLQRLSTSPQHLVPVQEALLVLLLLWFFVLVLTCACVELNYFFPPTKTSKNNICKYNIVAVHLAYWLYFLFPK